MSAVAILGTGRMGSAMARRLHDAHHDVRVWNRTATRAQDLAANIGCAAFTTAADAFAECDVVLCTLASGAATAEVLLAEDIQSALSSTTVTCDMGTSGPGIARTLDTAFSARGLAFVDSPVSGSVPAVLGGTLLVMASGDSTAIDRVEPVLLAFSKRVARLGPAGAGQTMKLAVNLILYAVNGAVAEGLALAEVCGIDRDSAYDVLLDSSIASPYVGYKRDAFLLDDQPVAMSIDLMAKDLALISGLAMQEGLDLPLLQANLTASAAAQRSGLGEADTTEMLRFHLKATSDSRGPTDSR